MGCLEEVTMSEIKKQVIKEIIARLSKKNYFDEYEKAMAILAIPELAVVNRNAELPPNPYPRQKFGTGQQSLIKAGWVKEIK